MSAETPDYSATIQQMLDLWIIPEITRRQESGLLPTPADLRRAQVIFHPNGRSNEVRINDEVKIVTRAKLKNGIRKAKGECIFLHEIDEVQLGELPDSEDPDCGHITVFRVGPQWFLGFDFRYRQGWVERLVDASKQFLEAARDASARRHWRAFIDNAYSAAELAAKAILLSMTGTPDDIPNSHKAIHSRLNELAKVGNIKTHHREVFNALARDRQRARYPRQTFVFASDTAPIYLKEVEDFIAHAEVLMGRAEQPLRPTGDKGK